jgi:protein gp37
MAHRFSKPGMPYEDLTKVVKGRGPDWTGGLKIVHPIMNDPYRWRKASRVFVNSMSDLFHENLWDEAIFKILDVIHTVGRLHLAVGKPEQTFIALTKRPIRMKMIMDDYYAKNDLKPFFSGIGNLWLGVSVENHKWYGERVPFLVKTPAAIKVLSLEPLLGPVDISTFALVDRTYGGWVIIGGESGPKARPCDPEWIRQIVKQCRRANMPVFVKQLGRHWAKQQGYKGKGNNPIQWPIDLRVREFPHR